MNLNQALREDIVAAVMKDVPRKRKDPSGDLQKLVNDDINMNAPPMIGAIWKDKALACYLNIENTTIHYMVPDRQGYQAWQGPLNHVQAVHPEKHEFSAKFKDLAQQLYDELLDEHERIDQARTALKNSIAGLRTVKAFIAAFPELEKYAPGAPTSSSNLPAIANVMAGLVNLGWPESKQAVAA